jgi:DNA primase
VLRPEIAAIRARHPLAEVVGRDMKLQRWGDRYKGLCPFHDEKSPSFTIYPDQHFYCFGCGAHGSVIDYVRHTRRLSFKEAFKALGGDFTRTKIPPIPVRDLADRFIRWRDRSIAEVGDEETYRLMVKRSREGTNG